MIPFFMSQHSNTPNVIVGVMVNTLQKYGDSRIIGHYLWNGKAHFPQGKAIPLTRHITYEFEDIRNDWIFWPKFTTEMSLECFVALQQAHQSRQSCINNLEHKTTSVSHKYALPQGSVCVCVCVICKSTFSASHRHSKK